MAKSSLAPLSETPKPTTNGTDMITDAQIKHMVDRFLAWRLPEDFQRWHNLKTQLRDEGEKANASGGVLNPALLSIG